MSGLKQHQPLDSYISKTLLLEIKMGNEHVYPKLVVPKRPRSGQVVDYPLARGLATIRCKHVNLRDWKAELFHVIIQLSFWVLLWDFLRECLKSTHWVTINAQSFVHVLWGISGSTTWNSVFVATSVDLAMWFPGATACSMLQRERIPGLSLRTGSSSGKWNHAFF